MNKKITTKLNFGNGLPSVNGGLLMVQPASWGGEGFQKGFKEFTIDMEVEFSLQHEAEGTSFGMDAVGRDYIAVRMVKVITDTGYSVRDNLISKFLAQEVCEKQAADYMSDAEADVFLKAAADAAEKKQAEKDSAVLDPANPPDDMDRLAREMLPDLLDEPDKLADFIRWNIRWTGPVIARSPAQAAAFAAAGLAVQK